MNRAHRTPAAGKRPEDFLPIPLPAVHKKVCKLMVLTKDGQESQVLTLILRPGNVVTIDGKTVMEY